jgi:hypothetical protein
MHRLTRYLLLGLLLPGAMLHSDPVSAAELGIAPVKQLTPEWCWAASAEMILRTTAFPVSTRLEFTSAVSLALKANHALATARPFLAWVLAGQPKRLQQSSNNMYSWTGS